MGIVTFLLVVGALAGAAVYVFSRISKSRDGDIKAARHALHHHKPFYQPGAAHHPVLHSHGGHLPSQEKDIWHSRRPHTEAEHWVSHTMTAHRVRYDGEKDEASAETDGLSMSTIEFTPEAPPAVTGTKH